jgi:uncharacterized protein YbaP (TraB family)
VTGTDGVNEGWLFGTIHELPDGVTWRTDTLDKALSQSEWLVVEIADLEATAEIPAIFAELAVSPGQPPLLQRVGDEYRTDLKALMTLARQSEGDFTQFETWAAAIRLGNALNSGNPENGVDRALISEFVATIELEGPRKQLGIFDSLPEKEQRDFLEGVVRESREYEKADPHELAKKWISGDLDDLLEDDTDTILADPELRAALLTDRNTAWVEAITDEMAAKGPLMVAVGAAHMIGEDGLPTLLTAQGYTVTRIQ